MSLPVLIPDVLSRGGLVKICGLRTPDHALVAAAAGADLLGLVFARSKRQVTVEDARAIVEEVREAYPKSTPLFVGVFVDADGGTINAVALEVGLDVAQVHGSETRLEIGGIDIPVIRAIGPPPDTTSMALLRALAEQQIDNLTPALCLIDGYDPVNHGGSGKRADWLLAAEVASETRMMLAGGLDPDNVEEAIRAVRPFGVDVSSGVERDGAKNPERIRDFVANAKRAFSQIAT